MLSPFRLTTSKAVRLTFHTIHFPVPKFTLAHDCDVFGVRDRPIFPRGAVGGCRGLTHALVRHEASLAGKCSQPLRCSSAELNYSGSYEFKSITAFSDIDLSTKKRLAKFNSTWKFSPSIRRKDRNEKKKLQANFVDFLSTILGFRSSESAHTKGFLILTWCYAKHLLDNCKRFCRQSSRHSVRDISQRIQNLMILLIPL